MNWLRSRSPFTLYALVLVTFLFSRALFFLITTAGEYQLYKRYGDAVRRTSLEQLYLSDNIEYPHLGVGFGAIVGDVADRLPNWCRNIVRLRPNKLDLEYQEEPQDKRDADDQYEAALGFVLFALDAWCLWLVFAIVQRAYPLEAPLTRAARLFGYVLVTSPCGLILYDRQDLVVAWLALLAIRALGAGWPRLGYAILVVGTAYKLVPALLLPVWVIATATMKCGPNRSLGRWVGRIAVEALIAAVMLSAWPALTWEFGGGERGFHYLTWHSKRGMQLEAPASFPILLADSTVEFGTSYGSFNLRGELPDRVAKFMGLLMPLAALASMAIAARGFFRAAKPASYQSLIPHVVASSLLIWVAFIAFNKVGSPQYLIWVAPLVPLLPLRTWGERGWAILFLIANLDTMLIFPCFYKHELVGPLLSEDPLTWRGPTSVGVFLLGIKSVTLILCTLWLGARTWRTPHIGNPPEPLA